MCGMNWFSVCSSYFSMCIHIAFLKFWLSTDVYLLHFLIKLLFPFKYFHWSFSHTQSILTSIFDCYLSATGDKVDGMIRFENPFCFVCGKFETIFSVLNSTYCHIFFNFSIYLALPILPAKPVLKLKFRSTASVNHPITGSSWVLNNKSSYHRKGLRNESCGTPRYACILMKAILYFIICQQRMIGNEKGENNTVNIWFDNIPKS